MQNYLYTKSKNNTKKSRQKNIKNILLNFPEKYSTTYYLTNHNNDKNLLKRNKSKNNNLYVRTATFDNSKSKFPNNDRVSSLLTENKKMNKINENSTKNKKEKEITDFHILTMHKKLFDSLPKIKNKIDLKTINSSLENKINIETEKNNINNLNFKKKDSFELIHNKIKKSNSNVKIFNKTQCNFNFNRTTNISCQKSFLVAKKNNYSNNKNTPTKATSISSARQKSFNSTGIGYLPKFRDFLCDYFEKNNTYGNYKDNKSREALIKSVEAKLKLNLTFRWSNEDYKNLLYVKKAEEKNNENLLNKLKHNINNIKEYLVKLEGYLNFLSTIISQEKKELYYFEKKKEVLAPQIQNLEHEANSYRKTLYYYINFKILLIMIRFRVQYKQNLTNEILSNYDLSLQKIKLLKIYDVKYYSIKDYFKELKKHPEFKNIFRCQEKNAIYENYKELYQDMQSIQNATTRKYILLHENNLKNNFFDNYINIKSQPGWISILKAKMNLRKIKQKNKELIDVKNEIKEQNNFYINKTHIINCIKKILVNIPYNIEKICKCERFYYLIKNPKNKIRFNGTIVTEEIYFLSIFEKFILYLLKTRKEFLDDETYKNEYVSLEKKINKRKKEIKCQELKEKNDKGISLLEKLKQKDEKTNAILLRRNQETFECNPMYLSLKKRKKMNNISHSVDTKEKYSEWIY